MCGVHVNNFIISYLRKSPFYLVDLEIILVDVGNKYLDECGVGGVKKGGQTM